MWRIEELKNLKLGTGGTLFPNSVNKHWYRLRQRKNARVEYEDRNNANCWGEYATGKGTSWYFKERKAREGLKMIM